MTKPINLYQFAKGLSTDDEELASLFEKVASERACRLSRIKSREIESLLAFVNGVVKRDQRYLTLLDGFVYAFSIPHISKEFDLLKIGQSSLVNIELKSERKSEFDLRKQLTQNAYYLSSLQKKTSLFEYISSEDKLYRLDEGGDLREETWQSLLDSVASVRSPYVDDYEGLFHPADYLVSPINDPERFAGGNYFLTDHQCSIKEDVLSALAASGSECCRSFLIEGTAGTGKTLLLFDIAKAIPNDMAVRIIHCGYLSEGHRKLDCLLDNVNIISIKDVVTPECFAGYDAILFDEFQRIHDHELDLAISFAKRNEKLVVFSLDSNQHLSKGEIARDARGTLISALPQLRKFALKNRIRTNEEMADFIRVLFGLKQKEDGRSYRGVKVFYADTKEEALIQLRLLREKGYTYIPISTSLHTVSRLDDVDDRACPNTHKVIGQEFSKVVMVVDGSYFFFGNDGKLKSATHPYSDYLLPKLLFQGLTRTREAIALIVWGNRETFKKLLEIVA